MITYTIKNRTLLELLIFLLKKMNDCIGNCPIYLLIHPHNVNKERSPMYNLFESNLVKVDPILMNRMKKQNIPD